MSLFAVIHYATPELVARTKHGLRKFWRGYVKADKLGVYTTTQFWQELADGTMSVLQESAPVRIVPKNVGKRNETTLLDQGVSEINAAMKRQRDKKGYREAHEPSAPDAPLLPMLAEKFLESSDKLTYPVWLQPKLDGTRALFDGARFTTRGGLAHPSFLNEHFRFDSWGVVLDGELMLDPAAPVCKGLSKVERFQLSVRAAKKPHPELLPWLRYYVYDVVDEDRVFADRYNDTLKIRYNVPPWVVFVDYARANTEEHVFQEYRKHLLMGFEGTMVRDDSDGYELGQRSYQLQKLKEYEDAEFMVIRITDGKGKDAGTAKLTCMTANEVEFDARLMGSLEVRQEVYQNRAQYVGKRATVRFEGYTKDGKPRFPRALGIREEGT